MYSQIVIYSKIGGVSQGDAHVRIDTQIKFLYYPLIVTGDNSDAVIDLGYEKNFHNGVSDYDNESLYIPIVPTLSEEYAIPMIADEGAVDHIPKNSRQCDRSHRCAHGATACTCSGGHDIVCFPSSFLLGWG